MLWKARHRWKHLQSWETAVYRSAPPSCSLERCFCFEKPCTSDSPRSLQLAASPFFLDHHKLTDLLYRETLTKTDARKGVCYLKNTKFVGLRECQGDIHRCTRKRDFQASRQGLPENWRKFWFFHISLTVQSSSEIWSVPSNSTGLLTRAKASLILRRETKSCHSIMLLGTISLSRQVPG